MAEAGWGSGRGGGQRVAAVKIMDFLDSNPAKSDTVCVSVKITHLVGVLGSTK